MLQASQQFDVQLYSTDPVDGTDLDCYSTGISELLQLFDEAHASILAPISIEEILSATFKVRGEQSSLASDGLGYAFLYYLFRYPSLQKLCVTNFNDGLHIHAFPLSWSDIGVRLLPKKSDLTFLPN